MTRMPRAIAPLVTTITSSPLAVQRGERVAHARQHLHARRAVAVGDDARPELHHDAPHAVELICARPELRSPGSSSNVTPPISISSPGSKPSRLERPQHADPAQPALEVGHRILVLDVVAREQPLDRRARARRTCAARCARRGSRAAPPGGRPCARPARSLLGARLRLAAPSPCRGGRRRGAARAQQLAGELAQPAPGRARGGDHGHLVPERSRHSRDGLAHALSARPGPPWRARARAAARARRASCAASSRSIVAWLAHAGRRRLRSSGAMSSTCTSSRVRSTCARKSWPRPAPSLAPSISPGMSATTAGAHRLRARPAPARAS